VRHFLDLVMKMKEVIDCGLNQLVREFGERSHLESSDISGQNAAAFRRWFEHRMESAHNSIVV
jgi:hypothetical protein